MTATTRTTAAATKLAGSPGATAYSMLPMAAPAHTAANAPPAISQAASFAASPIDEEQDVGPADAHRHADADLVRCCRDGIMHHRKYAERRHAKRDT